MRMAFTDEILMLSKKNSDWCVLDKAVEECHELMEALLRAKESEQKTAAVTGVLLDTRMAQWPRETREAVISEMADVAIMLRQLALKLECADELDALMEYKVARTKHEMKPPRSFNT